MRSFMEYIVNKFGSEKLFKSELFHLISFILVEKFPEF